MLCLLKNKKYMGNKMGFLDTIFLGARVWVWLYLLFSVVGMIFALLYFFKERIRRKYYELRFPEKLIKVVMHYKSGFFKEYYRLLPENDEFVLENKTYQFSNKQLLKDNEFFSRKNSKEEFVLINSKKYTITESCKIKYRWSKYPEIHYFYNRPQPINFDLSKNQIDFSSKQLHEFKENNLFMKLLMLDAEKTMMNIILMIVVLNIIGTVVLMSKVLGWVK